MQFKDKIEAIKEQFYRIFHWKRLSIQHERSLKCDKYILICFLLTAFMLFPLSLSSYQTHDHQKKSIVYVNIPQVINNIFPTSRWFFFYRLIAFVAKKEMTFYYSAKKEILHRKHVVYSFQEIWIENKFVLNFNRNLKISNFSRNLKQPFSIKSTIAQ